MKRIELRDFGSKAEPRLFSWRKHWDTIRELIQTDGSIWSAYEQMCACLLEDLKHSKFPKWADRIDFDPRTLPLRALSWDREGVSWILDKKLDEGDRGWFPELQDSAYIKRAHENFDAIVRDFPQEHHIESALVFLRELHAQEPFSYEGTRAYCSCRGAIPFSKAIAELLFPEIAWIERHSTEADGRTTHGHYLIASDAPRGTELVFDFTCRPESSPLNFMANIKREVRKNGGWAEEVLLLAGLPPMKGQVVPISGSQRAALMRQYKIQASYLPMPSELWYLLIRKPEHRTLLLDLHGNPIADQIS